MPAKHRIEWDELQVLQVEEGKGLCLNYKGKSVYVRSSAGAQYLYELLLHPHQAIPVYELPALLNPPQHSNVMQELQIGSLHSMGLELYEYCGGDPMMDERGILEMKKRLVWLNERYAELIAWNDSVAAEDIQREREELIEYLIEALKPDGKLRLNCHEMEAQRRVVYKSIRRALASISSQHPELGAAIRGALKLGLYLRFEPEC